MRGIGELPHAQRIGEHGMAEPVDAVGKLRGDAGINQGIDTGETGDVGAEFTVELSKNHVLVNHLDHQLGLLEELFTRDLGAHIGERICPGPAALGLLAREAILQLQLAENAVVLVEEDLVNLGEADVFIDPAIAGNEVGIEDGGINEVANRCCR